MVEVTTRGHFRRNDSRKSFGWFKTLTAAWRLKISLMLLASAEEWPFCSASHKRSTQMI